MLLPSTIDLNESENYVLSIRISDSGMIFSLSESNNKRNYCLRRFSFEDDGENLLVWMKKIIYELNFLTQQYLKTNVIFVSSGYDFIPLDIYEKGSKEDLLGFTTDVENTYILENAIPKYDVVMLSNVDEDLYSFIKRSLYNPQFYSHISLLIDYFEGRSKTINMNKRMYVNIGEKQTDIICFDKRILLQSMTYKGLTKNEQIYYMLKVWESLELDQQRDELLIAGDIDDVSLEILKEYIENIEQLTLPSEIYEWGKDVEGAPLDLLALSL